MRQKHLIASLVLLLFGIEAFGQTKQLGTEWVKKIIRNKDLSRRDQKRTFAVYDIGALWSGTDNSSVFGFIGDNYQRLRVKIIAATKAGNSGNTYYVFGKSMIRRNVCSFYGTIDVVYVRANKQLHFGIDNEYKDSGIRKQGLVIAKYRFSENRKCTFSGVFEGFLVTYWYVGRDGKLAYDDLKKESDSFSNNQFVGTWTSHNGEIVKPANWGDHRIPFSDALDQGAGEFSPVDKYLRFGWQTYKDAYLHGNEAARQIEESEWWR